MVSNVLDSRSSWYSKPSAERSILSLCLKDMDIFLEVSSRLNTSDFLDNNNRAIFTCLSSLFSIGLEVFDLPALASALNDFGMLESAGGYEYLDALFQSEIGKENVDAYVNQILNASLLYRLEGELKSKVEYVHSKAQDNIKASDVLSQVEESISSISMETLKVSDSIPVSEGILELLKSYETNPSTVRGFRSGFPVLDSVLNGFAGGGLYVVAARPKIGKSTLCMGWSVEMCISQDIPILYIDTEMPFKEDFQPRVISRISGVPERIIKNGLYSKDTKQKEAVYYAAEIMRNMKFFHKYIPGFKIEDVRSLIKKHHARDGIRAVFFDYIKMVELNDNFNETQTLGYLTSSLKDMAGILDIPIITAVQTNRTGEGKSRINNDQIADSDRVLRYCNVLMALNPKSKKEIDEEGIECGTHRLQVLSNRGGSSFYSGIDLMHKRTILTFSEASMQSSDSLIEQRQIQESVEY